MSRDASVIRRMPGSKMHRLIYASRATPHAGDFDALVDDILAASQRNNVEAGVTGLLLAVDGKFVQVLEGPRRALSERFITIAKDPRHEAVELLESAPADGRLFGRWSMVARRLSPDAAELLAAMNGGGAFDGSRLDGPVALRLLLTVGSVADGRLNRPPQAGAA